MNKINKYANGKIYCIRCKDTDKRYYGSTFDTLSKRLSKHVYDYKGLIGLGNVERNYRSSAEILINGNYEIFLVKDFPCYSRKELYNEEYNIIKENDLIYDVVNKVGKK
tara:strand:- start:377 stop:703 length:327 start_codon:yes stop_codon:yes gene_type:complete